MRSRPHHTHASRPLIWLVSLLLLSGMQGHAQTGSQDQEGQETEEDRYAAVEIIRLQHRDADRIRDALSPHLGASGSISQIGNNLIVSGTRRQVREVSALAQQLDLPRQALSLSIDFDYSEAAAGATLSTDTARRVRTVRVLEDEPATIRETETATELSLDDDGNALLPQVSEAVASELEIGVQAEIRGDQVLVQLFTYSGEAAADGMPGSTRSVETTLMLVPGRWYPLELAPPPLTDTAGPDADSQSLSTDPAATTPAAGRQVLTTDSGRDDQLAIRVDLLP